MSTVISLDKEGFRRLTADSVLPNAIKYFKQIQLDKDVILDLHGCFYSYKLAELIDVLIERFKPIDGNKKLTIICGYTLATPNHLAPYIAKTSRYLEGCKLDLAVITEKLKNEHQIDLKLKEESK